MHSLRKSALSMQAHSGLLEDEQITADAGHSSFRVTVKHYIKEFKSVKQRVADSKDIIFAQALSKIANGTADR